MNIDLIKLDEDYSEGIGVTYDDISKHLNIKACFEGGFCWSTEDLDLRSIPYVQEILNENVTLKKEISELKERVTDLYLGKEPNYESQVLMSKIEVLKEAISKLTEKLKIEKEMKEFYLDKYDKMYELINED